MEAATGRCRRCGAVTSWPDPWSARGLNRLCEGCQGDMAKLATQVIHNPRTGAVD